MIVMQCFCVLFLCKASCTKDKNPIDSLVEFLDIFFAEMTIGKDKTRDLCVIILIQTEKKPATKKEKAKIDYDKVVTSQLCPHCNKTCHITVNLNSMLRKNRYSRSVKYHTNPENHLKNRYKTSKDKLVYKNRARYEIVRSLQLCTHCNLMFDSKINLKRLLTKIEIMQTQ